jgi:hypothetical protein
MGKKDIDKGSQDAASGKFNEGGRLNEERRDYRDGYFKSKGEADASGGRYKNPEKFIKSDETIKDGKAYSKAWNDARKNK